MVYWRATVSPSDGVKRLHGNQDGSRDYAVLPNEKSVCPFVVKEFSLRGKEQKMMRSLNFPYV